jgi:peptidoglycan/xylan/chitin deacetylase (PgdA/CDA1 family)
LYYNMKKLRHPGLSAFLVFMYISCGTETRKNTGHTVITKWQGDKRSAISITYDDGIINQFTVAKPIMDSLGLPATFFIITGKVGGSEKGKFIGRPQNEIISETARIQTNSDNFFERASLIGFTGTTEAVDYHSRAGSLFETGKEAEAYALIDEGYEKLRNSRMKNTDDVVFHNNPVDTTNWKQYQAYAAQGHEIASHTVTHPRLAVLDEDNLLYELEQSRADIEKFLGKEYTFSAEGPYGTENERVMEYARKIYPALRNRMPEPYLDELNRASGRQPGESEKEYVQWQRGPVSSVDMDKMKGWVDTCMAHDNIWLVLVFHGIEGIGWEPRTRKELQEYFGYMKEREDALWIATFGDVTRYLRERKNTKVHAELREDIIEVSMSTDLDPQVYDVPVTLKTYIPGAWNTARLNGESNLSIQNDSLGPYVLYSVPPGDGKILLME